MIASQVLKSLWVGIFVLCCTQLYGQMHDKRMSGKVVDQSHSPIPLATVSLHDRNEKLVLSTATDSLGQFQIKFAKAGRYFVKVRYMGYQEQLSAVFEPETFDLGTFTLLPLANSLAEVAVEGKKKMVQIDGGTLIYNVESTIGGQDVSVLEALKRAPGVYVENESDITLNGKSGVQILLDGRQTFLSGKELTDLLKSLSSNNLKSIEIINSPTAKYEATGSAGIINIKTKKNQVTGLNGTISSTIAYGVSAKQLQNVALNYRKDKLNVYGNYSHTLGNYNYLYGTNRQQNGKAYDSHTDDVDKRQKMSTQVGADYYLNDKNTIGFLVNGNFIYGGGITDTRNSNQYPSVLRDGRVSGCYKRLLWTAYCSL
ncbi:carboxypeptidase regulatory-like domain-containing protein [Sphingobacterium sp. SG20118]|uniref:TonB-dependent receptor n=1 Tax=Sphingobacterium sp. SG20118 TaxID=3367156 RepID=UPI0037DFC5C6